MSQPSQRMSCAMPDNYGIIAVNRVLGFSDGETLRPCGYRARKQKQIAQ